MVSSAYRLSIVWIFERKQPCENRSRMFLGELTFNLKQRPIGQIEFN